jgi:GTP cyclohydrolase I
MDKRTRVEAAVKRLLTSLDVDDSDVNYRETPRRVAAWLMEKFPNQEELYEQLDTLAAKTFPSDYDEMISQTGIRAYGLCPHHLLPVTYDVSLGYIPDGYTIGLSKLARTAVLILGQVGTQEDLTGELADRLVGILGVNDVAVVVHAQHLCMVCRGAMQQESITVTSTMYGKFTHDDNGTKSEFLRLANGSK